MSSVNEFVVIVAGGITTTAAVAGGTAAVAGYRWAKKAVRLLEGEAGQPGVIDRLDEVEEDVEELETTVDIVASGARTDGGEDRGAP